jgi:hypothetical protein
MFIEPGVELTNVWVCKPPSKVGLYELNPDDP